MDGRVCVNGAFPCERDVFCAVCCDNIDIPCGCATPDAVPAAASNPPRWAL